MAETNEEAVALGQPPKEVRRLGAQTARSRAGISALPPPGPLRAKGNLQRQD